MQIVTDGPPSAKKKKQDPAYKSSGRAEIGALPTPSVATEPSVAAPSIPTALQAHISLFKSRQGDSWALDPARDIITTSKVRIVAMEEALRQKISFIPKTTSAISILICNLLM